MDYRLALMAGIDLPIPECQIVIHQPTIKEIAYLGETDFFVGVQCLCIQKTMVIQDEAVLQDTSNFQIFMTVMMEKSPAAMDKKAKVNAVLSILFPGYQVIFTPRTLLLKNDNSNIIIDENNFEILQQILEQIFCLRNTDQASFNPGNDAAKAIADKLMRARERVAKQKAAENGSGSAFSQYVSTLTVGLNSMSLQDCLNLTMYQLYDLVERYMLYVNWDIDLRSRLAGGKPDSQPDNWMKNIH